MSDKHELEHWLDHFERWAAESIHRRRLHRAFWDAEECLAGESERLLHSFSRLGIWAREVAAEVRHGGVPIEELQEQLNKVAEFGEFAFRHWMVAGDCQAQFDSVLHNELIPHFCSDTLRDCDLAGFRDNGLRVADVDARDFMRAWKGGLIEHQGRGRYRAPKNAAAEQFFWSGPKQSKPRTFTLWHEPIITVAALARLHWDFGWPVSLIGTQSSDGAFDLVAFNRDSDSEHIAGEVKKTAGELDALVRGMQEFGSNPNMSVPPSGKSRNAYKKVAGLRARRAPIFWAIGPGGYTAVFRVEYGAEGEISLHPANENALAFRSVSH